MAAAFSAMEPSSVKMYHTSTTGRIRLEYVSPSPGRFATAMLNTASVSAATTTTTSIPALCQIPARATALDHSPRLAAAALPLSQSSTMQTAQATTSHPSQPNAAVNAPQTAAMAAFAAKKVLLLFSISLPSISPHTGPCIYCLSSSPRPRPAGRSSPRHRCSLHRRRRSTSPCRPAAHSSGLR